MTYWSNIAYELDVLLSVITGGPRDTTVSLRVAKAAQAYGNKGLHPSCLLCKWLSLTVETDHCANVLADKATKPGGIIRAAAQFALVLGGIGGAAWWLL